MREATLKDTMVHFMTLCVGRDLEFMVNGELEYMLEGDTKLKEELLFISPSYK